MTETISLEDHRFLIGTHTLTLQALELDDLWTLSAGMPGMTDDDRQALLQTATEMQTALVELARRVSRVSAIIEDFTPRPEAFKDVDWAVDVLRRDEPLRIGDFPQAENLYEQAKALVLELPQQLEGELPTLGDKIKLLATGRELTAGDFTPRTRRILLALAFVVGAVVATTQPHVAIAAAAMHKGWRVAGVLCAAVNFGHALQSGSSG